MALEAPRNHRAAVYGGASGVGCPSAGHRQLVNTNGTSGLTFNDDRGPIRFGIMCRGMRLAAWQAETIRRLLAIDGISLSLLITDPRPSPGGGKAERLGRIAHSDTALWDVFNNGYVARRSRSLARVDCGDLFDNVPVIEAAPELRGQFSEYFTEADIEQIREHDLDFILRFAYGIIRGDILSAARHGVWSFHHGDEQAYRGSPPAFWEVAHGAPASGVILQRLTDRLDGGIVLRKGWFRTTQHSYVANTDQVHFGGTDFPAQVCRDLLRGDADYLAAAPSSTDAPIYLKPTDRAVAKFAATTSATFIRNQVSNIALCDQWNVGLVRAPIARFLEPDFVPEVEWFADDRGPDHYLADPFPLLRDGPLGVLAEDYDYQRRIGTIARLDFDDMSRTTVDIGSESHASYPYTFEHGATAYVAAQITGQQGVSLLTIDDNGDLAPGGRLDLDAETLDPTLFEHDGRWWLFFTRPGAQSLTELHIWWADDLFGEWKPHARNPVKTDIRSARPGGTPFHHDGALYRPAQDCSTTYGGAVSITRIDELTPDAFTETVVRIVEPDPAWPYPNGLHTLSGAGGITVLDAKRRVFSRHESKAELTARLRRLRRGGAA